MPRNNRDETDKADQSSYYGDLSAALLDPEQNIALNKQVLFIRTADTLDTSLHRSSTTARASNSLASRLKIARRPTSPPSKPTAQNGLSEGHVQLAELALIHATVTWYTRAYYALERAIGGVVRFKAVDGAC